MAKLIPNPRNSVGVNYVEISGLSEGTYSIWLKKESVRLSITVHSGKYWQHSSDFLLKERSMIERNRQRLDSLRVDSVTVTNSLNEEGKAS